MLSLPAEPEPAGWQGAHGGQKGRAETMYQTLQGKARGLEADLIRFAQEFVRTPSRTHAEQQAADLMAAAMQELGYDRVVRDDAGNVLGILFGRRPERTLLLAGHLDTAETALGSAWAHEPWSGAIEGGRLHGVGASDCKGGLAAQIFAGAILRRSLLPLDGTLVVAGTVAEECRGSAGVRHLVEHTLPALGLRPTAAVLGEPTGLGLYYGHDGWAELEVRVEGWDPFQVGDAARSIRAQFDEGPGTAALAGGAGESLSVSEWEVDDEAETGLRRALIRVDHRFRDGVPALMSRLQRQVGLATQATGDVRVDVRVRQEVQSFYTGQLVQVDRVIDAWAIDPFHPLMERSRQALTAAGCAFRAGTWQLGRRGMGTAGGVLVQQFAIPTIGYGPGEEAQAHAPNEHVALAAMTEAAYGTAAIAHGLIGVPVFGWTADEI